MKKFSQWLCIGCVSVLAASCQPQGPKPQQPNDPACEDTQGYTKDTSKQESFSDERTQAAPSQPVAQPVAAPQVVPSEKAAEKVEAPAKEPAQPVVEVPAAPKEQPVASTPTEEKSAAETAQNSG
jgi:hypothetical protein